MADHVRIREVDDRECVARSDLVAEAGGDLSSRHLRLVVVARHVSRTRDEDPGLARPLVLAPAVEEVGDVGVLLRLGDMQLARAVLGEHLGHRLRDVLLLERHRARETLLVSRHRREIEAGVDELRRKLAGAVGAEVEEDRGVAWP